MAAADPYAVAGDIRRLIAGLRRRALIVVGAMVVFGAVFALLTPSQRYEARADVLIDVGDSSGAEAVRVLDTAIELIASDAVGAAAAARVGGERPDAVATAIGASSVVRIIASGATAADAVAATEAVTDAFVSVYTSRSLDRIDAAIGDAATGLADVNVRVAELDAALAATGAVDATTLAERDALLAQRIGLEQRLTDLDLERGVAARSAEVIRVPETPDAPASRSRATLVVLGCLLGLVVGGGLAVALSHFDERVFDRGDLMAQWPSTPVLVIVPEVGRRRISSPGPDHDDACRRLALALGLGRAPDRPSMTVFTSPGPSSGKSSTAIGTARALRSLGMPVLIVDADSHRPSVHSAFGLPRSPGLLEALGDGLPLHAVAVPVPPPGRFAVVPAGVSRLDPSYVLTPDRLKACWAAAEFAPYEHVVVDAPPLLSVANTVAVVSLVDRAVLVVRAGHDRRPDIAEAMATLQSAGVELAGFVLVGATTRHAYSQYLSSGAKA